MVTRVLVVLVAALFLVGFSVPSFAEEKPAGQAEMKGEAKGGEMKGEMKGEAKGGEKKAEKKGKKEEKKKK